MTQDLPELPSPFDYCYEWDGPYGKRKFSHAPHNGRKADRSVPVYSEQQVREIQRQAFEAGKRADLFSPGPNGMGGLTTCDMDEDESL